MRAVPRVMAWAILMVWLAVGGARAEQDTGSRELVEKIVAGWRARQHTIQTLRARATVDSFFSKGYASAREDQYDTERKYDPVPAEDLWFRDQPHSWDFDFAQGRFRKEFRAALVCGTGDGRNTIQRRYHLMLFSDGKCTFIASPEEDNLILPDGFRQHVAFDYNPSFLIWPVDLPLLWCAGATITGQWPDPFHIRRIDSPDQYTIHAKTRWQDRECVIIRVRNQQSRNSVREFWVDQQPPYLIYRSQIIWFIGGTERVEQRTDVDYQEYEGRHLPAKWTWTDFYWPGSPNVFIASETVTIHEIEINRPLGQDLFTVRLKPGMGVISESGRYVVDVNGKLVPYLNPEQQRRAALAGKRWHTLKMAAGLLALIGLSAVVWFGYRRLRFRRRTG